MRRFCTIVALAAALLVASGGLTGDLTGSDDLAYLAIARQQAVGAWTPQRHQFHGRLAVTLPVAGALAAGVREELAWRIPGALALCAIALVLMRALRPRIGAALALCATLAVVCEPHVAEQARTLGPDLPAAALCLMGVALLGTQRSAFRAGLWIGLATWAKETPVFGAAALCFALAWEDPRRARSFAAGAALPVCAEILLWCALAHDPLFRLHAIQAGHNATVWSAFPGWGPHLRELSASLADFAPVAALLALGIATASRRALPPVAWICGGVLGMAFATTSLSRPAPVPPLPRMLVPFAVIAPLALAPSARRSTLAAGAIAALAVLEITRCPGPDADPLEIERGIAAALRAYPHDAVQTDERTAGLLAYLAPDVPVTASRGETSPALVVWNYRWIFFLHHAYGRPLPAGLTRPEMPLVARIGVADRMVALALGEGAEIRQKLE